MREINTEIIRKNICEMCIETNKKLPNDLVDLITEAGENEDEGLSKSILGDLVANLDAAKELDIPICQDTGMVVVFAEIGQDVHMIGENFEDAVNNGVKDGYLNGLLRLSIVSDPLRRKNTNDNTPAVIHTRIVDGDKIKLKVAPKGFGSENMSKLKMFTPSASKDDIINFVVDTVKEAGGNPCPPVVVGIGIGGDFEYCAYLSKKALCRPVNTCNGDELYSDMEKEMLDKINELDIGPQGFGGKCTALKVNIETAPTHIAGLPVAVNIGCHVTRHTERII